MYNNPYLQYQQPRQMNYMAPPIQETPFSAIKGRPVASIEEARAMSIDFDGSVFYFPDLANGKIYTKQINMDGTASLNVYEIKEMPVAQPIDVNNYVTRDELAAALNEIRGLITPPTKPAAAKAEATQFNF